VLSSTSKTLFLGTGVCHYSAGWMRKTDALAVTFYSSPDSLAFPLWMARRVRMASEIACCSACPCGLSTNACDRKKMAASAASTSCRNFCESSSRSAASNSRCQCGCFMFFDAEVSCQSLVASLGV
jgi:hypothetical protein